MGDGKREVHFHESFRYQHKRLRPPKQASTPSFRPFPFGLRLPQLPHKHLHHSLALTFPSVLKTGTNRHRQVPPIPAKTQRRDTGRIPLILPDPSLCHSIPQCHDSISTAGCERAVFGVKRQRIDGVDDINTFGRSLAVALESVLARLRGSRGIEPLDRDAAFDAGAGVAGVVGHAGHRSGHELQTAFAALPGFDLDIGDWRGRGGSGRRGQAFEVVDVERAGRHGDDEFGGGQG